jgi:hypothetical protein
VDIVMRGLLSATPGPSAIRLIIGTHLLLLIQAALVLWAAPEPGTMLRIPVGIVLAIAIPAFVAALHGLAADDRPNWWSRRHVR